VDFDMTANILQLLRDELKKAFDDVPPKLPKKIRDLGALPNDLGDLQFSTDDWSKLSQLLKELSVLGDPDLGASLVFRVLELRVPRLAGLLLLLGVVRPQFNGDEIEKHRIDWDSLFQFVSDPTKLIDYWLTKIRHRSDAQLLQIYLPTLAYAPASFLQMDHENLGFSSLSATEDPPRPLRSELQALIARLVSSPTPLPLPNPDDFPILLHAPPGETDTFLKMVERARSTPSSELWRMFAEATDPVGGDLANLSLTAHLNRPVAATFELGEGWSLTIESPAPAGTELELKWNGTWAATAPGLNSEMITFEVGRADSDPLALGDSKFLLLEVLKPRMFATVRLPTDGAKRLFSVGARAERVSLTIKPPGLKLLAGTDTLQASTDLSFEYVQGEGLRARSSGPQSESSIHFAVPINRSIGGGGAGLTIGTLTTQLQFALDNPGGQPPKGLLFRAAMTFDATGKLGPVEIVASGMGAWFGKWRDGETNPYCAVIAPTGIGASLNMPPISGGGFLQMEQRGLTTRIGGALSLKLTTIGIGALGLLEEGPDGTSFVFILGIRFTPGIQLSFGFELTGVGGLVGLNRRADTDVLRERLTSGAAGNVLFCSDPVREGPALLGYLGEMFPAARGSFLIGPTLQVSWISPIVRLNLGVLIEFPGPRSIIILGSLQALIGTEDVALVNLRIDFLGVIDLVKQQITFDASLVNSTILGILKITGDAAFRLSYGDTPDVVLSIGGFHPRFNAESLHLRPLARVGASVALDASIVNIWLRQEAYFAFTSNTLQFGGRTEAGLEIGPIGAHGFLSLDALVQFKPFYFDIGFSAGFDITVAGVDFCGVDVTGRITGPGPIVITASASVKLLFVRVSHSATFRLGSNGSEERVRISNLAKLFVDEAVNNPTCLKAGGNDPQVHNIADSQGGADAVSGKRITVLCPLGTLTWTQTLAPLQLTITRLRGHPLDSPKQITVTPGVPANSFVNEWFSPGQLMELNESQQLNGAGLFSDKAGMSFGLKVEWSTMPAVEAQPNKVDVIRLPKRRRLSATLFLRMSAMQMQTLADRLKTPQVSGGPPKVSLQEERWQVVASGSGDSIGSFSAMEAFQRTRSAPQGSRIGAEPVFCVPVNTKAADLSNVF
jgi:hypothetical protein